jgi:hypothetical protein
MPGNHNAGLFNMIQFERIRTAIVFSCFLFLLACSGVKRTIVNAKAYALTAQRGTVQVDDKGNEVPWVPETVITVYVEAKQDAVKFDSAWLNNQAYLVRMQMITNTLEIGFDENTGEKIIISPSPENYLYQLQIISIAGKGEELPSSVTVRLLQKGKRSATLVSPVKKIRGLDVQ